MSEPIGDGVPCQCSEPLPFKLREPVAGFAWVCRACLRALPTNWKLYLFGPDGLALLVPPVERKVLS